MEFERTLFRVHEKFLSIGAVKTSVDYCYKVSLVFVLISVPIFLYGNFQYVNTSACLLPEINKNYILDPYNKINVTAPTEDQKKGIVTNQGARLLAFPSEINSIEDQEFLARPLKEDYSDDSSDHNEGDLHQNLNLKIAQSNKNSIATFVEEGATRGVGIAEQKKIIKKDSFVRIKITDTSKQDDQDKNAALVMDLSGVRPIIMFDSDIRDHFNFTVYNVTIDESCYHSSFINKWAVYLLGYENIIINEIVYTFKNFDVFLKNNQTSELFNFPSDQIDNFAEKENIVVHFFSRLMAILKLLFGYFLVSNITSIYNKMTIICAPIFIIAFYNCCTSPAQRNADRMNIYRAFPWIGMYLFTLHNNSRKKDSYMICAFLAMIVIFYCLYLAALVFWNLLLFSKSFPSGLDENFYGFIALIEFLTLLFVRTRTTIKFFPQMSIILVISFLYYVQFCPYGFPSLALFIMVWSILGMFAYFLKNFEIPGTDWNPSFHYTPSIDSPRTLFIPVFSLTSYHDLPPLWTMFFPIFGRSYFSNAELAMVNRDYPLMISHLANGAQAAENNNDDLNDNNVGANSDFPLQFVGNLPQGQEDNNENVQEQRPGQAHLLQNADSDYIVEMGEGMGGRGQPSNRRNSGGDNNSGNRYRRVDGE